MSYQLVVLSTQSNFRKHRNTIIQNYYKVVIMENTIHTLQEYMLHTESITYVLIVAALIGITFFFRFLTERDDDED